MDELRTRSTCMDFILVNFRQCSQIEEMPEEDEEDIEADFDDSEMTTTAVDPSEMKEVREIALYEDCASPSPYFYSHNRFEKRYCRRTSS